MERGDSGQLVVFLQDIKYSEPAITLVVDSELSAHDVIKQLCTKARILNHNSYELAEIFVSSGQLCKERRLDMAEYPVKVQGLWPKGGALAPDATYRFYLVRKGNNGGFLRSLSWTECSHTVDVPLDSYLIKFLEQKTAGENYADLCALPDLNEKTLLENLKKRFYSDTIYTYVGTILIAINPFKFFPIYNPKYVAMYQDVHRMGELPPHIFAIANAAFTNMLDTQTDQCIVISGESGSGKTENTNFLLHHLTQTKHAQESVHHGYGVEQTLLGAGPVLEAFGNAKTVHNDNSSRFGKFILVDFRKNGSVHGASVEKYLLEKSRIVSQATNERNYHVFYYLLRGATPELAQDLFLLGTEDYHYLNQSGCYSIPAVDEIHEYERLKRSMEMVGFEADLQKRIFAVISAILLLGNIEFVKKHSSHHDEAVKVKDIELVSRISKLLDVKEEAFLEALTSKRTVAGGETVVVRYKHHDAISARNAMAKCLYGAIFDWIVWQINHSLFQKQDHKAQRNTSIGVLDIFGFENFNRNSFEQFCINYANEHLQYYFNQHIFKFEQEEYRREEIVWQDISFIDNRGCLELFAKRPSGLFFLLDEEGNFPGATNDTLLEKFHQNHRSSDYYVMPLQRERTFAICHYAGKVKYYIDDFREKNSDLIHADLVSVLKNSSTGFVRELVGCDPVAMLRWSYVRLCMKSVNAFIQAGKAFHNRGGNKIGNIRRRTSVHQKQNIERNPYCIDMSGSDSLDDTTDGNTFIHSTGKQNINKLKKHSNKKRQKMYKDYKQFKTHQELKPRETSKTKTPSVSLQFQKSLQSLLETLDRSHPYFVRCIKSNNDKEPCLFNDELVLKQLQYTGMLATVRLRQSGYNYRVLFEDFVSNYAVLLPHGKNSSRADVELFLTSMDSSSGCTSFQIGRNKVFLRETVKMLLDDALHHTLIRQILKIQSWVRSKLERARYQSIQQSAITIQRFTRGHLVRKRYLPELEAHRDQMKLITERKQQQLEQEALERQRAEEAEIQRRERLAELERENARRQAAVTILEWHRSRRAVAEAKSQLRDDNIYRALKLEFERRSVSERVNGTDLPSPDIPSTDIDQLAQSLDEEVLEQTDPGQVEQTDGKLSAALLEQKGQVSNTDLVESWLDSDQKPKVNGRSSQLYEKIKTVAISDDVSSKDIQLDDDNNIEPIHASTEKNTNGDKVRRRTSIERRTAYCGCNTKDDEQVIPVVQKRQADASPTSSSGSVNELTKPLTSGDSLADSSPLSPNSALTDTKDTTSRESSPTNEVFLSAVSTIEQLDVEKECAIRRVGRGSVESKQRMKPESFFYTPPSNRSSLLEKRGSYLSDLSSDLVSPSEDKSSHIPQNFLHNASHNASQVIEKSSGGKEANREPANQNIVKSPVRRTSSNDPGLLRGISSKTDDADRSPAALSPPTVPTRKSSRASSAEFDDDSTVVFTRSCSVDHTPTAALNRVRSFVIHTKALRKFLSSRSHVLRQHVPVHHVRKTQSADCLASSAQPSHALSDSVLSSSMENANSKGISVPVKNASKKSTPDSGAQTRSADDVNLDRDAKPNKSPIAKLRSAALPSGLVPSLGTKAKGSHAESDDSDLGDNFTQVQLHNLSSSLERRKLENLPQPGRSGSKKNRSDSKNQTGNTSQWSLSSTSEWNYPDNLVIAEHDELSALGRFIYDKYLEFRNGPTHEEREIKSVYDRVFRDALKEMNFMLITKRSLAKENTNSWQPLKFRDLMSTFQDYVKSNVEKNKVSKEQAEEFPTLIAINAFRGYLDEYQKIRVNVKRKPPKQHKPKEHRKKPQKEVIKLKGHHFAPTQFNIPTFCEMCNKMMFWNLKDRGLECENCKLSCHKKCSPQITQMCLHQPAEETRPNAVFGVSLPQLAGEDNSIPIWLERLFSEIENKGLYTEGIYRKSGVASRVRTLKKALDADREKVNLSDYAIHVLSLTLKNFFRELPEPLLTFDLYDEFIRCPDIANKQEALTTLRSTLSKLPALNLCIFSRLMVHLARVSQNEQTNRMSPNALATCFAPGLLRTKKQQTAQESLSQVEKQCKCLEMMITDSLSRLKTTLNNIDQIQTETQSLQDRLIDVRQSIRLHSGHRRAPASNLSPCASNQSEIDTCSSDGVDIEQVHAEEKVLSQQIKTLQEKQERLTRQIPRIARNGSDGDDILSTDDIETSGDSLDELEYT